MGLDNEFFLLLDYYFSLSTRLNENNTYIGLEFNKHTFIHQNYSSNILAVIAILRQCINTICVDYIKISPNTRIIPWILKCRSIILNTSASSSSNTSNDNSNGGGGNSSNMDTTAEGDGEFFLLLLYLYCVL